MINKFWLEVLSFGFWRKETIEECWFRELEAHARLLKKLRTFVQHSPDNREDLKSTLVILESRIQSANWWQQDFAVKAQAFNPIANRVLVEQSS